MLKMLSKAVRKARQDHLSTGASSAAFYLVLSIVPALGASASLFELVTDASAIGALTRGMEGLLPASASNVLQRQVDSALQSQQSGSSSWAGTALWFAVLLWSGSRGTGGIVDALNVIHDGVERRPLFMRLLIRLLLTLGAILLLLMTIGTVLVAPDVLAWLGLGEISTSALAFRWPVMFLLAAAAIAVLYRFGPSRADFEWRWILIGSATAAALWMALSLILAWYIQTFGNLSGIYGSFGSLAGFMIWIWLSALAVLVGAEVDAGAAAIDGSRHGPSHHDG